MRTTIFFVASSLLAACGESAPPSAPTSPAPSQAPAGTATPPAASASAAPSSSSSSSPPPKPFEGAKEGQTCGGIAAIRCAEGLTCAGVAKNVPDAAGRCTKKP